MNICTTSCGVAGNVPVLSVLEFLSVLSIQGRNEPLDRGYSCNVFLRVDFNTDVVVSDLSSMVRTILEGHKLYCTPT
jgi:hypothetical protein